MTTKTNDLVRLLVSMPGWKIFPLKQGEKAPENKEWQSRATSEVEKIENWTVSYPNCNWGLATGPASGIIIIDVDAVNGGVGNWERVTKGKPVPRTTVVKTGGGGRHFYFRVPDFVVGNPKTLFGKTTGIHVKGKGGLVVIPPSIHPNGNPYEWEVPPWDTPPAALPLWLMKKLKNHAIKGVSDYLPLGAETIPEGERNDTIYHQALKMAREGTSIENATSLLLAWKATAAPQLGDGEITDTVNSAYKKAKENAAKQKERKPFLNTDVDNADRFLYSQGENVLYVEGLGWHVWNGSQWKVDGESALVTNMAIAMLKAIRNSILLEAQESDDDNRFNEAKKKATQVNNAMNIGRIKPMISLAATDIPHRKKVDDFDGPQTDHLLNVKNGVVNLETGEITPHNRDILITRYIDVDYLPEAKCEFWERTLELALNGNKELINYMKRAIGYTITGRQSEQCMFIAWGAEGNNGKSTIMETLASLLGSNAASVDMKVLTPSELNNQTSSTLAQFPGVRFVHASEAETSHRLNEPFIKMITGGDTISGCHKYKAPFTFKPKFKLWIRTNEKPHVSGMGEAFWRRIKLIPFDKSIPPELRILPHLVEAKLKTEYEGILNWCVQGAIEWSKNGLQDPQIVRDAIGEYKSSMDVVSQFFDELIDETDKTQSVPRAKVYQTFVTWSRRNGLKYPLTAPSFNGRVSKRLGNQPRILQKGEYIWSGIQLNEQGKILAYEF